MCLVRAAFCFRVLGPIVLVLLGFAAAPPHASAATGWRVDTFPEFGSTGIFFAADCPSPTLCVVAGSDDAIASSTEPAAGIGHWQLGHLTEPGSYGPIPTEPGGGAPILPGAQIRGISCPTTRFCVAVTRLGGIFTTTNPAGGAGAWSGFHVQESGPRTHIYGVSCPSTSLCVAVALGGKILTSTDPGGGAWSTVQLPEPLELLGVSCSTTGPCLAVGKEGALATSTNPTGGAAAWTIWHEPGFGELLGVACAERLCLTGNPSAVLSSYAAAGGPSSFSAAAGATPLQLTAFDCVDASACAAVNNNADVIASTEPAGGAGTWKLTNIVPYNEPNGTFGISCPSTQLCIAVGTHYLIASSTEPFGGAGTPSVNRKLRRLTVELTGHPRHLIRTAKARVQVRFRFREIGLRTGFLCKLGGREFRPCKAPKRYRVGPGPHVFAVKVADPGGADQSVTRFRFRVVRIHHHR